MSPLIFIIFGATGDLMHKKLMPAIYSLFSQQQVSDQIYIIAVGRRELSQDDFRNMMKQSVKNDAQWEKFSSRMEYMSGFFEDPNLYTRLVSKLEAVDGDMKACIPRFFYLATPPEHYETILMHLRDSKLSEGCGQGTINYTRVLIEKPFGKNRETAEHLDQLLGSIFEERQIYRIDHYLAKETIQNMIAFRFANGIFEPTWNKEFIDHIQIKVSESSGIGNRGGFYEGIGASRDVVQNHMMQMLSIMAMEQPKTFDAQSVRNERTKVIESIVPLDPKNLQDVSVRGQYQGYLAERGVAENSQTETYVALKLLLNIPRWEGVPFYLRTGKKMQEQSTEISVHYKKPALCESDACFFDPSTVHRNVLRIGIQPDELIDLRLMIKRPGFGMKLSRVHMEFKYADAFPEHTNLNSYEKLLLDAIAGDQMLFARTDEIDASWNVLMPLLDAWQDKKIPLLPYEPGGWGPPEAKELIERDGRYWYLHEK